MILSSEMPLDAGKLCGCNQMLLHALLLFFLDKVFVLRGHKAAPAHGGFDKAVPREILVAFWTVMTLT